MQIYLYVNKENIKNMFVDYQKCKHERLQTQGLCESDSKDQPKHRKDVSSLQDFLNQDFKKAVSTVLK